MDIHEHNIHEWIFFRIQETLVTLDSTMIYWVKATQERRANITAGQEQTQKLLHNRGSNW